MLYDSHHCWNANLENGVSDSTVKIAAQFIKEKIPEASIAIVLGSGFGDFTQSVEEKKSIPYSQIPHFPKSTVEGHFGNFVWGKIKDIPIFILEGRFHYYEGKTLGEVTFPVRVLKKLGIQTLILTNAAGSLNRRFRPGEFLLIKDHLNLIGDNPLRGKNWDSWGPRFPNLTTAYDSELRQLAKKIAKKMNFKLLEGIYAGIGGPSYETPAEAKMLQTLGADAVGMSTIPEVIVAAHQGTRICAFSCLSNYAADLSHQGANHQEVLHMMKKVSKQFSRFLCEFIVKLSWK